MADVRRVAVLLFDGVEVLDFAGPFEVFGVAGSQRPRPPFDVFTVAMTRHAQQSRTSRWKLQGEHDLAQIPRIV